MKKQKPSAVAASWMDGRIKMEAAGSFGAGRAGSVFNTIAFITQPQTILRILSWIFSMVVFGSIVNEGYVNNGSERLRCVFNRNDDACNYSIVVGIGAFLASIGFFALDIYFPQISSVKDRKKAVLLEIACSGLWTFLWFVGFCFLANQWQRTLQKDLLLGQGKVAAQAAVAFSFFSIITWNPLLKANTDSSLYGPVNFFLTSLGVLGAHWPAGLTARAVQRYLMGTDMTLFTTEHMDDKPVSQPYPTPEATVETTDIYKTAPPFSSNPDAAPKDFQVPTY